MKKARPGIDAHKDVENAVLQYAEQSVHAADFLIEEYKEAITAIERMPGVGSLRFAHELGIPNLRAYSLHSFPYLIFYIEQGSYIDIFRVLHSSRDIYNLPFGLQ